MSLKRPTTRGQAKGEMCGKCADSNDQGRMATVLIPVKLWNMPHQQRYLIGSIFTVFDHDIWVEPKYKPILEGSPIRD